MTPEEILKANFFDDESGFGYNTIHIVHRIQILKAMEEYAKLIRDKYEKAIPIKHYKADPDDMFDIDCDVTGCCGLGPVTDEKYCSNCGTKIDRQ